MLTSTECVMYAFMPSNETRRLEDLLLDARLDRRAYRIWVCVTIVWVLVVLVGGFTYGVWLGVSTNDLGGPDYGAGAAFSCIGAIVLGGGGGWFGTYVAWGYWHDGTVSPGRRVTKIEFQLERARYHDANHLLKNDIGPMI